MDSSIPLFTVRGISVRIHITFPLILVWGALQFGLMSGRGVTGAIFGVVVTILLFAIVLLHELGHSLAAQRFQVPVRQIVLMPLGGIAQLERIPKDPRQEFVIAIAGPLVNFVLAVFMSILGLLSGQGIEIAGPGQMLRLIGNLSFSSIYTYVFWSNLFLGLFNLLPAFPMDGGRILRAMLASRMEHARATVIAASVGQAMAALLGLWGFLGGGIFLILIAIFIYMGAGQEGRMTQVRSVLGGLTVEQAYSRHAHALRPTASLREAIQLTLSSFQADFPVCEEERLIGLLTYARLIEALERHGPEVAVGDVMLTDVFSVTPNDEVFAVQQRMSETKLDAVPVVDGDRFLGLITNRDISEIYRLVSRQPELITATRSG